MKGKIIMLKGLPGSGKSTWAQKYVDEHPEAIRINKDTLRAMLHNDKHSKGREKFVLDARDIIAQLAVQDGKTVIIDDTNFHPKHEKALRGIQNDFKCDFEIKDFTDVPLNECIANDLKREKSVGERAIKHMARMYGVFQPKTSTEKYQTDPNLPTCVICDIDGTLALLNGRNPYDASTCVEDLVNYSVKAILDMITTAPKQIDVQLFSGRSDKYKNETLNWLKKHDIIFNSLVMRKEGDVRKDAIVKKEMFDTHIRGKFNVLFVLDDRDQCIDLWRNELGLNCFQVNWGDF